MLHFRYDDFQDFLYVAEGLNVDEEPTETLEELGERTPGIYWALELLFGLGSIATQFTEPFNSLHLTNRTMLATFESRRNGPFIQKRKSFSVNCEMGECKDSPQGSQLDSIRSEMLNSVVTNSFPTLFPFELC